MPSCLAIAVGRTPRALSAWISAAFARAVGARPLYFPSVFALTIPSRCRSNIILRSNYRTDPMTLSISQPVTVDVSRPIART